VDNRIANKGHQSRRAAVRTHRTELQSVSHKLEAGELDYCRRAPEDGQKAGCDGDREQSC
jgi:hypothetical protein